MTGVLVRRGNLNIETRRGMCTEEGHVWTQERMVIGRLRGEASGESKPVTA